MNVTPLLVTVESGRTTYVDVLAAGDDTIKLPDGSTVTIDVDAWPLRREVPWTERQSRRWQPQPTDRWDEN